MTYWGEVQAAMSGVLPKLAFGPLIALPFIIAEQIWPVERRPGWRDYGMNWLIGWSTFLIGVPIGVAAALSANWLHGILPWQPLSFSFGSIGQVPVIGGVLKVLTMIFVPLLIHDLWFYWAHRIEHKVPFLWEFHKLHHSDEMINCTTSGRDHFLQATWIAFFPLFTLGLIFDLEAKELGEAAGLSMLFLILLSNFYHSAIKVRLPWFDRILVTPQVHRIHHSSDPAHYNCNFADGLPVFDMLFGTFRKPERDEFATTGLGSADPAPRTLWRAQAGPVLKGGRRLFGLKEARTVVQEPNS